MLALAMADPTWAAATPPLAGLVLGHDVHTVAGTRPDLEAVGVLRVIGQHHGILGDADHNVLGSHGGSPLH